MATTLAQLRSSVYNYLPDTATSNVYTTSLVDQLINDVQVEICDSWKWQFLQKMYSTGATADTALDGDITTADTTIDLDSTDGMPTSGAIRVDHDIIPYTGITGDTLTGVTGIMTDHTSGAVVAPLITMPTDYGDLMELLIQTEGDSTPRKYTYVNQFDFDQSRQCDVYTIVQDNDGTQYIQIRNTITTNIVIFHYLKTPTTMSADGDFATIPTPYALKVIPKIVAGKAMVGFGDDINGIGTTLLGMGERELFAMQKQYGEKEQGYKQNIKSNYGMRTRPYSRNFYNARNA